MNEPTYRFTRTQLIKILGEAVAMFVEMREQHEERHAAALAVAEILDGLDADRELVAMDGHEKLRLQLPTPHHLLVEADASAESYDTLRRD